MTEVRGQRSECVEVRASEDREPEASQRSGVRGQRACGQAVVISQRTEGLEKGVRGYGTSGKAKVKGQGSEGLEVSGSENREPEA